MKKYVGVLAILLVAAFFVNFASAGIKPITDDSGRDSTTINGSSE